MPQVQPAAEDWQIAGEVHGRFLKCPGAQRIATPFALAHLAALLRQRHIGDVFEIGAGIGTITYLLLLQDAKRQVYSVEDHPFCVEALERNIPANLSVRMDRIGHDTDISHLPGRFDLVVVDGLVHNDDHYDLLRDGAYCFVEGSRSPTRREIESKLSTRDLFCKFNHYAQGRRRLPIEWRRTSNGFPYPRLKVASTIKGCWIGHVLPMFGSAMPAAAQA